MAPKIRFRCALFALGVGCVLQLHAQIAIEFDDLPLPGDVITRYSDTIPAYGPGPSGPDQVWDMSMALTHVTTTTTVSTAAGTPFASAFATSDLAMTNDGTSFLYFRAQLSSLEATGFGGDPLGNGEQVSVPFNPTLLVHQLPRTYGSTFTDNYYFQAIVDGSAFGVHSVRLRHRGEVRDTTDGHGTLITPAGTYQTLRVKSTEYSVDSVWFRLLAFAPWTLLDAFRDTAVTYSWLAKETKLAVAEMNFDSLGAPARFIHSSIPPSITTAVPDQAGHGVPVLWPVPATDNVVLRLSDPATYSHLQVTTMDGRIIHEQVLGDADTVQWNVSRWSSGLYWVRVFARQGGPPRVMRMVVE